MALYTARTDEHPLLTVHKHWLLFARDTAAFALGGIFAPIAILLIIDYSGVFGSTTIRLISLWLPLVALLWLVMLWMALTALWVNYYLDLWVVTDRHLINLEQIGFFDRRETTWGMDAILDVVVLREGMLQEFFDYGTLRIATAGPTDAYATAVGIPHPDVVRDEILSHIRSASDLQATAEKQEQLLHTVSHEVKGHLAKSQAAFAGIVEGDFGAVPDAVKDIAGAALTDTRKGVDTVMGILEASNFKKGTLAIAKHPFDLRATVERVVAELKPDAAKKGLALRFAVPDGSWTIPGDEDKLSRHVIRNLIDNAIHYTPQGFIEVELGRGDSGNIILSVRDSGVGLTADDMSHLFTEGGKGAESTSVNPASTGYGLFIAKEITDAHGGRIWAESGGRGTGSRFFLELPVA